MQKTTFKTRLLALLTAVFMVVVSIPFAAFADNTAILNYYCSGDANHSQHQAAEVTISASSATSVTLQEVKDKLTLLKLRPRPSRSTTTPKLRRSRSLRSI